MSTSFVLSALCAIGGLMGYFRKNSVPSLVGGLVVSALYGSAGYIMNSNGKHGEELALGASIILFLAGLVRSYATGFSKPIPLLLLALGAIAGGFYFKQFNQIQRAFR
ncbi:Transmembrane proteins 14C family protein [Candida parapsilosis]|uniref:Transmembrane protein 14 n=2 Tax=Candida parapsilosis TaxID=5480 RepID=G8BFY3_CANPC|nr:uncharacterized protein CPAR2_204100 [Candida parapsilosis]KAF6055085.1 Transmembrane proteins 14C family protein [Candida parapsilosis]KAF6055892.1 Transmembrane proteins 14C family protein [Candida parapsilosis]KAF6058822.1 Transmembrane proteins 14C family protein [Candida parapsilosis]KAF6067579.1 Transmembrane proteins 14C family protein [Candida parapsilosis]KAI5901813.1 TMEM14 protein [Candida parapsilosis]